MKYPFEVRWVSLHKFFTAIHIVIDLLSGFLIPKNKGAEGHLQLKTAKTPGAKVQLMSSTDGLSEMGHTFAPVFALCVKLFCEKE